MKILNVLLIIISALVLSGCEGACFNEVIISGTVSNGSGSAIAGVDVYVTHISGYETKIATTDASGGFRYRVGRYEFLKDLYIVFKKSGLQDFSTQSQPMNDDGGYCADRYFVRNAVMVP